MIIPRLKMYSVANQIKGGLRHLKRDFGRTIVRDGVNYPRLYKTPGRPLSEMSEKMLKKPTAVLRLAGIKNKPVHDANTFPSIRKTKALRNEYEAEWTKRVQK